VSGAQRVKAEAEKSDILVDREGEQGPRRGTGRDSRVAGWVGSGEEAVQLARQGSSAVARGGVGLALLTCLRLSRERGRAPARIS
jgi:hypothetical protein